ncbi:Acyl-CoA-binding domain-containing protein 6 [Pseudolycoriella hygida]|uniref:Acyl-CoA-binding domain-containing protein 6 n=1 Tax=Pseudolycoriella hygida TaxID=35572 RepID=A0A9Q0MUB9_9DIPT|nr:Acyl-CoA-binding domain-containing protein 6 [Pseudolycoriella hygida]
MSDTSDFEEDKSEIEQKFERAATYLGSVVSELNEKILLSFYGLYKQATVGACNTPKPGLFSLQAKAKWNAWHELKDMTKDEAMKRYVDEMEKLYPSWGGVDKKQPKQQWVSVSTFQMEDDSMEKAKKSHFDYVKEGDLETLSKLPGLKQHLSSVDADGLGLIHWAADRGNAKILEFLLDSGADVNLVDPDGQTALHYASSCGHLECIRLLIKFCADRTIKDSESQTCVDVAENSSIADLLRSQ